MAILRFIKRRFFWILTSIAFLGAIWAGYLQLRAHWQKTASMLFREGTVRRGDIAYEVKCTGTVQPILSVQVGAPVSGPIKEVNVNFNDRVVKDQLLAELDPRLFDAQLQQAQALLNNWLANVAQSKAKLHQTERDFQRAKELSKLPGVGGSGRTVKGITDTDYDLAQANYEMAAANVQLAEAKVEEQQAVVELAKTNLGYTKIRSPVDGIVIDRKVDAGQTLASQYQTPVMFVVAPELDKKVWILASVDEADIGLVRKAEANKQPVVFTVDAYREEKFEGKIIQVRLGPKSVQPNATANVVTYVAVVEAPNTDLKLLPGMTANLVFRIDRHENVLRVPNAALRFHPKPEFVHPRHLAVLEGLKTDEEKEELGSSAKEKKSDEDDEKNGGDKEKNGKNDEKKEATSEAEANRKKYVWIIDGERLSPVQVTIGLSDSRRTELLSDELKEGAKVVTGMKTAAESAKGKN
jgi:HlyD family secretion protein